jgi:hypothetical protein
MEIISLFDMSLGFNLTACEFFFDYNEYMLIKMPSI